MIKLNDKYKLEIFYILVGILLTLSIQGAIANEPHKGYAGNFARKSATQIYKDNANPDSDFSVSFWLPATGNVAADGTTSDGLGDDTRTIWKFTNTESDAEFLFMCLTSGVAPYTVLKEIYFYVYKQTNDWAIYGEQYGYGALDETFDKEYLKDHVAKSVGSDYWQMGVEMHTHWSWWIITYNKGACSFIKFHYTS